MVAKGEVDVLKQRYAVDAELSPMAWCAMCWDDFRWEHSAAMILFLALEKFLMVDGPHSI